MRGVHAVSVRLLLIAAAAAAAGARRPSSRCCVSLIAAAEAGEAAEAAVGGHLVNQVLHSLQEKQANTHAHSRWADSNLQ
jgi:hypothetical protein